MFNHWSWLNDLQIEKKPKKFQGRIVSVFFLLCVCLFLPSWSPASLAQLEILVLLKVSIWVHFCSYSLYIYFFFLFSPLVAQLAGSQFPNQRFELRPWYWKHRVLTTRSPENSLLSQLLFFITYMYFFLLNSYVFYFSFLENCGKHFYYSKY